MKNCQNFLSDSKTHSERNTKDRAVAWIGYNLMRNRSVDMTNAEKIRNMSDEELAEIMSENTSCYYCKVQCEDRPNSPTESSCNFRWLEWLQSEAE